MSEKIKSVAKKIATGFARHKWRYIIIVLIVAVVAWRLTRPKASETSTDIETLVPIVRQTLEETIDVSGTISSANYSVVQTQAIGTITDIYVEEGEQVAEGDKLFALELTPEGKQANQSAYSSYLQAQNSLRSAENQLNSLQVTLFDKNKYFLDHADEENLAHEDPDWIMQWADWLAAEGSYKNQEKVIAQARASLSSAYQNYRNTGAIVYAPASGTVENITAVEGLSFGSVSSGSGISLSARLATIKTGDQILALFNVSASDILKIELGQRITLDSSNLPHQYEGEIVSVDRYGTTGTTTTYQVIARFDADANPDTQSLLPNLSVDGEIHISQVADALVIPTLAITTQGATNRLQVVTASGEREWREVTTGITSGNLTQITDGVSEGEQVVFTLGAFDSTVQQLMNGMGAGGPPSGGGNRGNRGEGGGPR